MTQAREERRQRREGRKVLRDPAERLSLRAVTPRALWQSMNRFLDHHLMDWGAALTFYAALSLIPAMVAVLGGIGLISDQILIDAKENLSAEGEAPLRDLLVSSIETVRSGSTGATLSVVLGLAGVLWTASSYVGGFLRASGVVHDQTVRYPFRRLRPLQLALTLATVLAITGTAIVVAITGPVAEGLASLIGARDLVATIWDLAKWPLVIALVLAIFGVLYWASPDVRNRGLQLITPGGLIATGAWVIGSIVYAIYVENIANYNNLYGSLGAVIGFIIWLWGSNMAMLYGVELNSAMEPGIETPATTSPRDIPEAKPECDDI